MKTLTTLLLSLAFVTTTAVAEKGPAVPDYPADKITDNTYVIHGPLTTPNSTNQGFMNNPGIVMTSAGIVIVDPGGTLQSGEMVLRQLAALTSDPVVAVFNTHIHGDHWLGNQAIKAAHPKVQIYGHPRMLEMVEAGEGHTWVDLMEQLTAGQSAGTKVVGPTKAIAGGDIITVGNTQFRIHHYGKAHTETDLMIEVVEESVVFLGDNVLIGRVPRISDGDVMGNITSLDKVMASSAKHYVPGHGKTGDANTPKSFQRYLNILYTEVKKLYEDGMSDFEMKDHLAKALAIYSDWEDYDVQLGKHISLVYLQIEEADF
jgi:glyoxylase-like metal-dependent hydrolase (beta-lactamase superfamily II)